MLKGFCNDCRWFRSDSSIDIVVKQFDGNAKSKGGYCVYAPPSAAPRSYDGLKPFPIVREDYGCASFERLIEPSVDEADLWESGKSAFLVGLYGFAKFLSGKLADTGDGGKERPSLVSWEDIKDAVNEDGGNKFTDNDVAAYCRALFGEDRSRRSHPANIVRRYNF